MSCHCYRPDRNCLLCRSGGLIMDNSVCSQCGSYQLYLMVTSGKPYCYSGNIPCLTCKRFSYLKDNFTLIVENNEIEDEPFSQFLDRI